MEITHNEWNLKTVYIGEKAAPWSGNTPNYNHHRITVKYLPTGKQTGFNFWCSLVHPRIESKYDIMNAFRCFVDDCLGGSESFEDFCSEFGYDTDSRKAYNTWKECRRSKEKLERITDGKVDIYDLINSLEEYE